MKKLFTILTMLIATSSLFAQKFSTSTTLPIDLDAGTSYTDCSNTGTKFVSIPVSGLENLNTTNNALIGINLKFDECGGGTYSLRVNGFLKSPNGTCIKVFDGLDRAISTYYQGKVMIGMLSDIFCLNPLNTTNLSSTGNNTMDESGNGGYFSTGHDLALELNGENPNGTWILYWYEASGNAGCLIGAELVFGKNQNKDESNSGDNCANAIEWKGYPICASNFNKTFSTNLPDWKGPGPVNFQQTCDWNGANNNDIWFKIKALDNEKICANISGLDNNLQTIVVTDSDLDGDGNACTDLINNNGVYWNIVSCPREQIYNATVGTSRNQNHCWIPEAGKDYYVVIDGNGGSESPFFFFSNAKVIETPYIPYITKISGNVYFDENENGIRDISEIGLKNKKVLLKPDSIFALTDNNGDYVFTVDSGKYDITTFLDNDWQITSDSLKYNVVVDSLYIPNNDFGLKGIDIENRLNINLLGYGSSRCNTIIPYVINYSNLGNTTNDGIIKFKPDEKLSNFDFYDITPDSINQDTSEIFWSFNNLRPGEEQKIKFKALLPDFQSMGETLNSKVFAYINDSLYDNKFFNQTLRCSFDPNDKMVYPEGEYEEKLVLMDSTLSYTIRFQNTGNDTAINIRILDLISDRLDLNTFELLASSHNVKTIYTNEGKVEFIFDSIMLVDSIKNEPESHGFVKYKIKAKSGLEDITITSNTAYIYFDSNPAVVTNTVYNTLTYNIIKLETEDPIRTSSSNNIKFYPNPFSQTAKLEFDNKNNETYQLQITDITGKLLQSQQSKSNVMIIEKGNMPSGMYFYKLQNTLTKESYNGKFVVE